jgi:hypothetical protein
MHLLAAVVLSWDCNQAPLATLLSRQQYVEL